MTRTAPVSLNMAVEGPEWEIAMSSCDRVGGGHRTLGFAPARGILNEGGKAPVCPDAEKEGDVFAGQEGRTGPSEQSQAAPGC